MKSKIFRFTKTFVTLASLALLPLACSSNSKSTKSITGAMPGHNTALVRFVNATSYKEPVALYRDETELLSSIKMHEATPYSEWTEGIHQLELRTDQGTKPMAVDSGTLSAGEHYTVIGYNRQDGTPDIAVFHDDMVEPAPGKTRVRLINLADGAGKLDMHERDSAIAVISDVEFDSDCYADVEPVETVFEISKDAATKSALELGDIPLESGRTETIIVSSGTDGKLHAVRVPDATASSQTAALFTRDTKATPYS